MEKYLLIDGSAVIHRAFHALPLFNAPNGTPTNAVYGFIKMLLSLVTRIEPDYLSVVYDTPVPTFRKKLMPSYQSHRPPTPDEFRVQVPLTREFLDKAKVRYYFKEGFEADDVIATIVEKSKQLSKAHFYILTGDKDILQLVNDQVTVVMPRTGASNLSYMDEEAVKDRLGILPNKVVDYKALVGDPSDNYPGVKGIGPKGALKLLNQFGSVTNIYQNLDKIDAKTAQLLEQNKENALLCARLAKLVGDVDFPHSFEADRFTAFSANTELTAFFDTYALSSLKQQFGRLKKQVEVKKTAAVDKTGDNQLSFF